MSYYDKLWEDYRNGPPLVSAPKQKPRRIPKRKANLAHGEQNEEPTHDPTDPRQARGE